MKKIYIFAAIAAVLAGALLYFYLGRLEENSQVKIEYEPVLVAAQDIPAYSTITEEMVTVSQVPKGSRYERSATEPSAVVGMMTQSVIFAGEQMIPDKLTATGDSATTLAYAIPKGMRAITIAVNDVSGGAGLVRKGDFVDVIAYVQVYDAEDVQQDAEVPVKKGMTAEEAAADKANFYTDANTFTTMLCVQNVQVAAIGRDITGTGDATTTSTYEFITLFVTPGDAMRISEAEHGGLLTVMLRGTGDDAPTDEQPINKYDLLSQPD